jgi:preprotein translocase subunit Sec63
MWHMACSAHVTYSIFELGRERAMANNSHQILGVSSNASRGAIKAAFRRLVRRYHPDSSGETNASEKFIEVVQTYRALMQENIEPTATTSSFKKIRLEMPAK